MNNTNLYYNYNVNLDETPDLNRNIDKLRLERDNLGEKAIHIDYSLFDENEENIYDRLGRNLGYLDCKDIMKKYFSKNNIDNIQKEIKLEIKKKNYYISDQNEKNIFSIMNSIYDTDYKTIQTCDINEIINILNKKVVKECVKQILISIKSYLGYINEIKNPGYKNPINRFKHITKSIKGSKVYDMSERNENIKYME